MVDIAKLGFDVDTRNLKKGADELGRVEKAAGRAGDAAEGVGKKARSGADQTRAATSQMADGFDRLRSTVLGFAGAIGVGLGVREITQAADEWTNITNRLRLVTESSEELVAAQEEVFRIAREGRQSLAATAELYQRIATNQEAMGLTTAGLNRVTETISKTLAISGANAQGAEAALVQLGQAFSAGVLRGEELNSVMEQAPALARAIAQGMGKTVGELRALGAEGLLTSQQVVDALLKQGAAVDEQFGRIAPTVSQAWTVLGNAATQIIGRMDEASGASGGAARSILKLADTLSSPEMIQGLSTFASGAAEAFRVAVEAVGTFVNAVRWLGEEIAAKIHGVALNDMTRMQEALDDARERLERNTKAMSAFYAAGRPPESHVAALDVWIKKEQALREERDAAFQEIRYYSDAIDRQRATTDALTGSLTKNTGELKLYTMGATGSIGVLSEQEAALKRVGAALDKLFDKEHDANKGGTAFLSILNEIRDIADPVGKEIATLADQIEKIQLGVALGRLTPAQADKIVNMLVALGDKAETTASQVEEYLERLRKQAQGTGDALKDAFNAPGKAINEFAEGTGKAVGSLREMFKEGDSGYKALTIGLNALNAMQAINAVLNQSAGDPYTAFARMATMAATVAALGYSVGMGGGGSDRTAANRQAEQGTGSVLGDATAKTESIARATEITADATTALVGLNRSMLVALQGLQAGIAGAVTRIARGAGDVEFDVPGGWSASQQRLAGAAVIAPSALAGTAFQSLQLGSAVGSTILGPIGAVAGALGGKEIVDRTLKVLDKATLGALSAVGKLIGGSSKQVDEGITFVGGTLAELIDETMVSAYATIKSKKYKWSSSKYNDVTAALDADVGRQFELVFQGIAESVTAGAAALGLEQSTIDAAVSGYVVESLRISLQGLKPEEQREALDAVFGKVFDGLAETVIPYIADFTAYGEGLGETLARVANAVMVTEDVVDRLGVRFQQLAGADLADASLRLVELAGGIEELARNSAGFLQNFATPERQMEVITRDLERALGQVNLQLPVTRAGFYELVQAQDASTQSGAEAIATLLRLQDYAADYYDRLEDAARATAAAAEEAARATAAAAEEAARAAEQALAGLATATDSAMTALQSAVTARVDAAKGAYQTERAALEEKHKAAIEQIKAEAASRTSAGRAVTDAFKTSAQALQRELQGISGAIGSLRDAYEPMQEARRVAAMDTLRRALSTGDLTGTGDAAQLASRIEKREFASLADFQREQGRTLNLLSALEKEGSRQVDWAERAAANIDAQTAVISSVSIAAEAAEKQRFDEQMAELDARHAAELAELESVVTTAQDQLNALRGIETGVLAIPDAIAALAAALDQEFIARSVGTQNAIDAAYKSFGRTADAQGAQWWHDEIMSGRGSIDDLNWQLQAAQAREIMNGVILPGLNQHLSTVMGGRVALPQIPQFADGGEHVGGWRVVGESGPELEFTGPSRIYSNTQSKGIFDIAPIIQELRALNQRMAMLESYSRQTTKNTGTASRVLDRWEGGGMPAQREALV